MPYIRAERKEYHKKNKTPNYNSIIYDETFVRIRSPGDLRSKIEKVESSRVKVNSPRDS